MKLSKEIAIGVLASALSLGGLSLAVSGCASKAPAKATTAEKGADHKCGAGNCGADGDKADAKGEGEDKGALASCGAGSCG